MADDKARQERLLWTGGEPVWPREPDIEVVRSLAKHHLAAELPNLLDDTSMDVSFFAEGGFNKLYQICYAGHHTSYLLRAAVPIEPYYKTESEVATIAYLRANTTIPVPRVLAWDSNRNNELTFEWILMEKIDGVSLMDVWRKVPWERKLVLTATIAGFVKQLRDQRFERIGGLYFKSAVNHATAKPEEISKTMTLVNGLPVDEPVDEPLDELVVEILNDILNQIVDEPVNEPLDVDIEAAHEKTCDVAIPSIFRGEYFGTQVNSVDSLDQAGFAVGRMFDPLFFVGSRPYLPGNRGPYQSSLEWLSALVRVQLEWIKNGPVEDDEEYGEDLKQDFPMMERLCKGFLDILPTVCSDEDQPASFCLHHSDLNASNILVNPETFEITGIVDWEFINVVPEWRAFEYPHFLVNIEPMSEVEPPIPVYEDNEDDIAVYVRDRWDDRILRRHFDQTMSRATQDNGVCTDDAMRTKVKRDCRKFIPALSDVWNWSKIWLKTYKTTGVSKNAQDHSKESRVYGEDDSDTESDTWLDEMQS